MDRMYQVSKAFQNTLNPTDYWNPNSRLESSTWNPEFVVWLGFPYIGQRYR